MFELARSRTARPIYFLFLAVPFGVPVGYMAVTLEKLLTDAGVGSKVIGSFLAISAIPHIVKFVWAPLVDSSGTRRGWYLGAVVVVAAGVLGMGAFPATSASVPTLTLLGFLTNVAGSFLGASLSSLVAYSTPGESKGEAGGWLQAGNLAGTGIGGGLALWLASTLPTPAMSGAALAVTCLVCTLPIFLVEEPEPSHAAGGLAREVVAAVKDLWNVVTSRAGLLAFILLALPIGAGAASQLWANLADGWSAPKQTVALVIGVLQGIVSAVGCAIGGWGADRMDRKRAYLVFGALQAACAAAMAFAPRTPLTYVAFTMIYAFTIGLAYAGFTAVVLEAIGRGAAATKYNVYASFSNIPGVYMTAAEGWIAQSAGPRAMLLFDGGLGVLGIVAFAIVGTLLTRRR